MKILLVEHTLWKKTLNESTDYLQENVAIFTRYICVSKGMGNFHYSESKYEIETKGKESGAFHSCPH